MENTFVNFTLPLSSSPQLRQSSFPSQADSGNSHPESLSPNPVPGTSGRNNQAWTHGSERPLQPTLTLQQSLLSNLHPTSTKETKTSKNQKPHKSGLVLDSVYQGSQVQLHF